jgi:hypothetical protein
LSFSVSEGKVKWDIYRAPGVWAKMVYDRFPKEQNSLRLGKFVICFGIDRCSKGRALK